MRDHVRLEVYFKLTYFGWLIRLNYNNTKDPEKNKRTGTV